MAGAYPTSQTEPDGPPARSPLTRPIVWLLTIFIVVAIVALPIARAISANRHTDNAAAINDARAYVATQFARSVLERRSTRIAQEWASDTLHDDIDEVVGEMQLRAPATLSDTTASVTRVPCAGDLALDDANACYQGLLSRPNAPPVAAVRFTVAIVDGRATVVAVQRGTQVEVD